MCERCISCRRLLLLALGKDIDSDICPISLKPFNFLSTFLLPRCLYRDDPANTEHPSDQPFRLVLVTSKGVIVCLVVSPFSTSSTSPATPSLDLSRSGSWCLGETPTVSLFLPPSDSSAVPSGKIEQRRSSGVPDVGGVVAREREEELEEFHLVVFLRRCFRFTHELLRTAIRG